ncbi:hypothetical protein QA634_34840 [Methylobacterium sp. CB376]|uniref:hypothetical protein n=1 Tax=unclassified Methylobacterium TaxID=2615210 RepID=UPI0024B1378F|nr:MULTISPECIES: hypothetical protein [Methylobacterium]WFT80286.1 hypothetical protein QA634_34840 [Methylobacterium nodulans]
MKGRKRCRLHGGAIGSGAPRGKANGRFRDGLRTAEVTTLKRQIRELLRSARATLEDLS